MKFTRFKIYLLLPILCTLIVFLGIILAWFSTKNEQSVLLMLGFTTIYLILLIISAMIIRSQLRRDFVKVGVGYSEVQKEMMSILAVPFAVMDLNADILWANYEMQDLLDSAKKGTKSMSVLFPNKNVATYSLCLSLSMSHSFVAFPRATGSTPSAAGSSVPV